jgi:hypothetical protein
MKKLFTRAIQKSSDSFVGEAELEDEFYSSPSVVLLSQCPTGRFLSAAA